MGEGEDDSGSLDSDSDLILDGETAAGAGAGKFQCMLSVIREIVLCLVETFHLNFLAIAIDNHNSANSMYILRIFEKFGS